MSSLTTLEKVQSLFHNETAYCKMLEKVWKSKSSEELEKAIKYRFPNTETDDWVAGAAARTSRLVMEILFEKHCNAKN